VWPEERWLKDTRLSLNLANIFNERQSVMDPAGMVPLRYQPGYLDPLGRTVEIELRKTF
jgi:iron complex outermembrane recepter protein